MEEKDQNIIDEYIKEIVSLYRKNRPQNTRLHMLQEPLVYVTMYSDKLNETFIRDYKYAKEKKYANERERVETLITLGMLHLFSPIEEKGLNAKEAHLISKSFLFPHKEDVISYFEFDALSDKETFEKIFSENKTERQRINAYRKVMNDETGYTDQKHKENYIYVFTMINEMEKNKTNEKNKKR